MNLREHCLTCICAHSRAVINNNWHTCHDPTNPKRFVIIRHKLDDGIDHHPTASDWCPFGHSFELLGDNENA